MVGFFQKTLCVSICILLLLGCNSNDKPIRYESDFLQVEQLKEHVFVHVSYLQTNDYGKVKCNGAIFRDGNEVVIFDTPTNDQASDELITWVQHELQCEIVAVVPTHFHDDCLGGIASFDKNGIKSYAHTPTIELASKDSIFLKSDPFESQIQIPFGNQKALIIFFGKGHTFDNVVAYYPKEKTLFGGCLVKSMGAGKGYLGAADTTAWSATTRSVKSTFADAELIIPGHGKSGGLELLDYTANLFDQEIK